MPPTTERDLALEQEKLLQLLKVNVPDPLMKMIDWAYNYDRTTPTMHVVPSTDGTIYAKP